MALFESYERRIDKINSVLNSYGIASIEEAEKITKDAGLNVYDQIKGIQPICFENACWAYTVGAAIAIKKGCKKAADAAAAIGEGLQAFCIPGSVADTRKVGLGHGNLGKMLLEEETECFCFLAGHESFAAAEGAIGIAEKANKVRQKPLRVILNGLGKDAAQIISRINGFTYVETEYDPYKNEVKEVFRKAYSEGLRAKVNCYGANSVPEGVAIMWKEDVDVSITGNSTNPTRFQHPVAGTYKKERLEAGKKYFSVASGGGTGRTLHPDNMAAGPASYGMTDTLGRMHSDAQFAGSSSVPAHVEMMGLIGAGNNPMVGKLDNLAWLLNLRAMDIECTPYAMAYCYVTPDRAVLFIHTARVTPEAKAELEANGVTLAEYDSVLDFMAAETEPQTVLAESATVNYAV